MVYHGPSRREKIALGLIRFVQKIRWLKYHPKAANDRRRGVLFGTVEQFFDVRRHAIQTCSFSGALKPVPVYVYVMGMLFYVIAGVIALPPCLLLALLPLTRPLGLRAAGGIIGSYLGVLLFQLLTLPVLLASFALFWVTSLFPMSGAVDTLWNALLFLVIMAWMGLSSLTGFIVGWRVFWHLAGGVPLRSALRSSRLVTRMLSMVRLKTWLMAQPVSRNG